MEALVESFFVLMEFIGTGIYDFVVEVFAYAVEWLAITKIQFLIFITQFSWDIASNIIANLGLSAAINSSWSTLDSDLLGYLTFFRIPEAINILIQAYIAKFVMRMIL